MRMASRVIMLLLLLATAAGLRSPAALGPKLTSKMLLRCAERGETAGRGFGATKQKSALKNEQAVGQTSRPEQTENEENAASIARGRQTLEKMRRAAGEDVSSKPTTLRQQLTKEELEPIDPTSNVMPEVVADRMLKRIVPFAGIPVLGAFALFSGFWYANTQLGLDLPPSIVAYSTQALFFLSFAGISWGVMSTSWDEAEEGSLLGTEEVSKNTRAMQDGLSSARADAAALYAENDAADEGIIMSKRALQRLEKRSSRSK
mmetsp:Transcript_66474/g.110537  ORF Transcript_66474/g.110537 Transcript_66474/m.110537 type:complete len:261 (+) Transcript_66474:72-854(+)